VKQHITSRQNVRVKEAAKLRLRRQRERQGRILIDGGREVLRALDAGVEVVEAFVCESLCDEDARQAARRAAEARAEVATVTEEVFEKLCFGERAGGIVAVAAVPRRTLADLKLPAAPLVAVLEGLEKPGNVGAVLRSADGAGLDAVVVAEARTDLFNPNAIRASVATVFNHGVAAASTDETIAWLRALGVPLLAARPDAKLLYSEVDYRRGAAIVLGSEAEGLSDKWSGAEITPIGLPMRGLADSLNVSAAAAVLFYEAQRQRGSGSGAVRDASRGA
jgi:TrmH family RNA methyltransferase